MSVEIEEKCSNCGSTAHSVMVVDGNIFHLCTYNQDDADYAETLFDQIPYGDKLNYGFSMTEYR